MKYQEYLKKERGKNAKTKEEGNVHLKYLSGKERMYTRARWRSKTKILKLLYLIDCDNNIQYVNHICQGSWKLFWLVVAQCPIKTRDVGVSFILAVICGCI